MPAEVLGGPKVLAILVEPLVRQGQAVAAGGAFDWRTAEAALYCIRCAAAPISRSVLAALHHVNCWPESTFGSDSCVLRLLAAP